MFETLEIGRKVKRKEFNERELELRQKLLTLQFELENRDFPVIIIVSGVEGAGKGSVLHRINEWMDPRLIETNALWDQSDEEENRPFYWRFWRCMPANGRIGIFFGSWYTRPIFNSALGDADDADLGVEMQRIAEFERMLTDDGALIIKLWYHLGQESATERLEKESHRQLAGLDIPTSEKALKATYEEFKRTSEKAIRLTDNSYAPWNLIEAEDKNYREITTGEIILRCLEARLNTPPAVLPAPALINLGNGYQPTILDTVDTEAALESDDYKEQLAKYQGKLEKLAWQAREKNVACVAVFEGWDAAGKGSAIRRVTQAIDPRLFHLLQFAAPSDEERSHHYLWRFWRQLGRDGKFTMFDRSWYGRVLVERVEGFAEDHEWQRAYAEINRFEEQLVDHGSALLKFWIHISSEEQLARFEMRQDTPYKQHKITEEDWRNREKWHDYELAVHDMVSHTSTRHAPWTLVPGNDKRYARVEILKTLCQRLEVALERKTG